MVSLDYYLDDSYLRRNKKLAQGLAFFLKSFAKQPLKKHREIIKLFAAKVTEIAKFYKEDWYIISKNGIEFGLRSARLPLLRPLYAQHYESACTGQISVPLWEVS